MGHDHARAGDEVVPLNTPGDWREGLPTLTPRRVSQFLSLPPTTIEGFERFIRWTDRLRAIGEYACFAMAPRGSDGKYHDQAMWRLLREEWRISPSRSSPRVVLH